MNLDKLRLQAITEPDDETRLAKAERYARLAEFERGRIAGKPFSKFISEFEEMRNRLRKADDPETNLAHAHALNEMMALAKDLIGETIDVAGQDAKVVKIGLTKEAGFPMPTLTVALGNANVVFPIMRILS